MQRDDRSNPYTRLSPVPGEPDACDVEVNAGSVNFIFHVSRLFLQRRKLESHVAIDWQMAVPTIDRQDAGLPMGRLPPTNCDWRSNSALKTLRDRMHQYYDSGAKNETYPWTQIIQWAAERVDEFITTVGDFEPAQYVANYAPEYIIQPVWPATGVTMWYGQPETGKGELAIAAGFALCSGHNMANLRSRRAARIIYLDYEETSRDEFDRRMSRYANALEMPIPPTFVRWGVAGRPFVDTADQLKAKIAAIGGADGLIIDSALPAVGGQANDAEPVGAFFTALGWIGLPTLLLGHETKNDDKDQSPFGSQLWRALSRMTVNFQSTQEVQKTHEGYFIKDVLLRCTKANNVRRFAPLAFRLTFTDDEATSSTEPSGELSCTWLRQIETSTVSTEIQSKLPLRDRLRSFLRDKNEPIAISDIAKETGIDGRSIAETFRRNPSLFRSYGGGAGRGNAALWRVVEAS